MTRPTFIKEDNIGHNYLISAETKKTNYLYKPFQIFRTPNRFLKKYYIYFPEISKAEYIGPFWTLRGADKYGHSLVINTKFVDPYTGDYVPYE